MDVFTKKPGEGAGALTWSVVLAGIANPSAVDNLAKVFGRDRGTIEKLITKSPVVIKRGMPEADALNYARRVTEAGGICSLHPDPQPAAALLPQGAQPAAASKPGRLVVTREPGKAATMVAALIGSVCVGIIAVAVLWPQRGLPLASRTSDPGTTPRAASPATNVSSTSQQVAPRSSAFGQGDAEQVHADIASLFEASYAFGGVLASRDGSLQGSHAPACRIWATKYRQDTDRIYQDYVSIETKEQLYKQPASRIYSSIVLRLRNNLAGNARMAAGNCLVDYATEMDEIKKRNNIPADAPAANLQ